MTINKSEKTKNDPLRPTIYHEDWWLKAATNGNFDEILIQFNNKIVGRLPFVVKKIRGRRTLCGMPSLTHALGPGIIEGNGLEVNNASKRDQIIRDIVDLLPKTSGFYQKMHCGIKDVIAFQLLGFQSSVEFTYELHPKSPEMLWRGLRDKTRNVIRRASEQFVIEEDVDPDEFMAFYNRNLARQNVSNSYDLNCALKVCEEAVARNRGRILAIKNKFDALDAAIFYIWDNESAYYFMSTRNHDSHNGAIPCLIWEAILDAATKNIIFDFDGLGTSGSNLLYRGFGGRVSPRYTVSRGSIAHDVVTLMGRFANKIRG